MPGAGRIMNRRANDVARGLHIYYDGRCGLCLGMKRWAVRRDRRDRLDWRDVHASAGQLRRIGVQPEAALHRLHVLTPEGEVCSGAWAVVEIMRRLPRWRWLAPVLGLPGVARLAGRVYDAVARYRHMNRRCGR